METDETISLQRKKLALEIAELERPWWKRPGYILAALPTLLAIIALSVGFLNGFFSAQLTKLDNQKHDLEAQIREFEGTRNALITENEKIQHDLQTKRDALGRIQDLTHQIRPMVDHIDKIIEDDARRRGVSNPEREMFQAQVRDVLAELAKIAQEEK